MKSKLFREHKLASISNDAAARYLEQIEFKKTALNIPALLIMMALVTAFCILIFVK